MTECLASVDVQIIAFLLLGMAAGIVMGAVWVDAASKSRKDLGDN